jgi:hypothetical protein
MQSAMTSRPLAGKPPKNADRKVLRQQAGLRSVDEAPQQVVGVKGLLLPSFLFRSSRRLVVEASRPIRCPNSRKESPAVRPREIFSRSAKIRVSARLRGASR